MARLLLSVFLLAVTQTALNASASNIRIHGQKRVRKISTCEDVTTKFDIGNGNLRSCTQISNDPDKFCPKWANVQTNCPVTCDLCPCEDVLVDVKFDIGNGKKKTCAEVGAGNLNFFCGFANVLNNCPATCNLCGGDATTAPTPSPTPCADLTAKFDIGNGILKSCYQISNDPDRFCPKWTNVQTSCPIACGICKPPTNSPTKSPTKSPTATPTICEDVSGKVEVGTMMKKCNQLTPFLCKKYPSVQSQCKVSCALCIAPTNPPTDSPTGVPSMTPSNAPSGVPSMTPSVAPSNAPSVAPTSKPSYGQCELAATLAYPSDTDSNKGFHSDFMIVRAKGSSQSCHKGKKSTKWGCIHDRGNALFDGKNDIMESEHVSIENVRGGTFEFTIQHEYNLRDKTSDPQPSLTISVNGVELGSYIHPKNLNHDSFLDDGSLNPSFGDTSLVTVTCDDACNCSAKRNLPTCEIQASITFPKLYKAPYYGYHNDFLTVSAANEYQECNKQDSVTDWGCVHQGNALIWKTGDETNDNVQHEVVSITHGENGFFFFQVKHKFGYKENDYDLDHMMAGTFDLWINSKERGTWQHETKKLIDTDNPEFQDSFYVSVECNESCNCLVTKGIKPVCKIRAEVTFPNIDDAPYYGYHNDYVEVSKIGSDEECNFWNRNTEWTCVHKGDAYIMNNQNEIYYDQIDSEDVLIRDGVDGRFRFTLKHFFSKNEKYYNNDYLMAGTMAISVNGESLGSFQHSVSTEEDTHKYNGEENNKYTTPLDVWVECDDKCDCTAKKGDDICMIHAELTFPSVSDAPYYGYHNDYLIVSKEGEETPCYYDESSTSWGCHDTGDAMIAKWKNYSSRSTTETVIIDNPEDSSYVFQIRHYNSPEETYYDQDHKMVGTLKIYVHGEMIGVFRHNVGQNWKNIYVSCDSICLCTATNNLE